MTADDLEVGAWYRSPQSPTHLLRYEGQATNGAYIFSRFTGTDPGDPGENVTTIEIYNVDELEPCKAGD
jgi:hypothetical protein